MADLRTIKTYDFEHEAELDKSLLESEGIFAAVIGGNFNRMDVFGSNVGGGVFLQVLASDVERALIVLSTPATEAPDIDAGWGSCCYCGSTQLELKVSRFAAGLSRLIPRFPVFEPRVTYRCKSCGRVMKVPKAEG